MRVKKKPLSGLRIILDDSAINVIAKDIFL